MRGSTVIPQHHPCSQTHSLPEASSHLKPAGAAGLHSAPSTLFQPNPLMRVSAHFHQQGLLVYISAASTYFQPNPLMRVSAHFHQQGLLVYISAASTYFQPNSLMRVCAHFHQQGLLVYIPPPAGSPVGAKVWQRERPRSKQKEGSRPLGHNDPGTCCQSSPLPRVSSHLKPAEGYWSTCRHRREPHSHKNDRQSVASSATNKNDHSAASPTACLATGLSSPSPTRPEIAAAPRLTCPIDAQ